jgi:hypothetical protein
LAQVKSDWELQHEKLNWREQETPLPPYPKPENLIEFRPSEVATFSFFIDRASLMVGEDGVVRYTLVARSPSGVENVSYEGIRCESSTFRVYATARNDRSWVTRTASGWREIPSNPMQRWHHALHREYFCPQNAIIRSAAEGVDALRRGGHPNKGGS